MNKKQKVYIEQVKKILASHDIRLEIYACGCCHSPSVKFEYKDVVVLDGEDCSLTMFPESEVAKYLSEPDDDKE